VKVEVGEELLPWRWGLVKCGVKSLNCQVPSIFFTWNTQHTADCSGYVSPIAVELLRIGSIVLGEIPQTLDLWRMF
jgi:hypothetical protein